MDVYIEADGTDRTCRKEVCRRLVIAKVHASIADEVQRKEWASAVYTAWRVIFYQTEDRFVL